MDRPRDGEFQVGVRIRDPAGLSSRSAWQNTHSPLPGRFVRAFSRADPSPPTPWARLTGEITLCPRSMLSTDPRFTAIRPCRGGFRLFPKVCHTAEKFVKLWVKYSKKLEAPPLTQSPPSPLLYLKCLGFSRAKQTVEASREKWRRSVICRSIPKKNYVA